VRVHDLKQGLEPLFQIVRGGGGGGRDGGAGPRPDALNAEQLAVARAGADEVFAEILAHPGEDGRAYHTESGRLPHRYSYGTASASRQVRARREAGAESA
jgi:hypothetical protein